MRERDRRKESDMCVLVPDWNNGAFASPKLTAVREPACGEHRGVKRSKSENCFPEIVSCLLLSLRRESDASSFGHLLLDHMTHFWKSIFLSSASLVTPSFSHSFSTSLAFFCG